MDDLAIRGGMILDGTGAEPVRADLAVRDGRIAAITPRHTGPARRVVDAQGLTVAPGFIDIKTHSDFTLPYAPRAESKILQGVTTEVVGHCGFSLAPVVPGRARPSRSTWRASRPGSRPARPRSPSTWTPSPRRRSTRSCRSATTRCD